MRSLRHRERHAIERIGWLRAAVLGANDGIISTASLILGVAAASGAKADIMLAGVAGLVAGAMSMAAGEFVSVSSQADTERSDLDRETKELESDPAAEQEELTNIYIKRGLDRELAQRVARELMAKDALGAHARDELGISEITAARPVQAAITSAITFSSGAALPLLAVLLAPLQHLALTVAACSLVFLAMLGVVGARAGGAGILRPTIRVTFWGALAMAVTAGVGLLIGRAV
jgi:VIT1/CCC1 family predicted Fe2+/Mn2+ transporter